MTAYSASRRRLATLRRPDKILITLFSVTLAIALVVGILNYHQRTQLTAQGTEEWYRGNEADPQAATMKFEKTALEMLDVTHPHLFFQAIMFFILCHIFSLSEVSDRRKVIVYAVAFGSVVTEAGIPWLIRFVSGAFAPLMIVSSIAMSAAVLVLLVVPVKQMWWPARQALAQSVAAETEAETSESRRRAAA